MVNLNQFRPGIEFKPSSVIRSMDSISESCDDLGLIADTVAINLLKVEAYTRLRGYDRCLQLLAPLLEKAPSLSDSSEFQVHNQLGVNYFYLGAYEKSTEEFSKALALARTLERPREVARIQSNLFSCYKRLGKLDSAMNLYHSAIKFAEKNELDTAFLDLKIGLGIFYLDNGPIDSCFEYLRIGLSDQFLKTSDTYRNSCLNLGVAYERTEVLDSAYHYYRRAVALSRIAEDRRTEFLAQHNLAYLSVAYGDYQQAFNYLDSAVFLEDSVNRVEIAERINALELKYKSLAQERELESVTYEKDRAVQARNNTIYTALLLLAIVGLIGQYLINRSRANRRAQEQRIEQLKQEKEVISLHTMLLTQEDERRRIAMDLHDGIGVILNTARLKLTRLERDIIDDTKRGVVQTAQEMLEKASGEVRRVSQNMMPGVLTKLGLADAIEDLVDKVNDSGHINVQYHNEVLGMRFHEDLEVTLYRIAQELLNNALKHSKASEVHLTLERKNDHLSLRYKDNGVGFDQKKLNFRSTGLESIRSRVRFLEGKVDFRSSPGNGLQVTISQIKAPLEND